MTAVTSTLPAQTVTNIATVGKIVTYQGSQYTCYSVEGYDYYAFQSAIDQTTVDFQMPKAEWLVKPQATLLPMGAKIGEGVAVTTLLENVRRGVCLAK